MSKWKLLKGTPTASAGTICEAIGEQGHIIVDPYGVEYDVAKIDDFDKWFEEVKEFQSFKCMTSGLVIVMRGCSSDIEEFYRSIGNAYPLDTPDELIIKEQKLIPQALHRLKMAAKKAWFEFNGSDGPDWDDLRQCQFEIHLDRRVGELYIMKIEYTQSNILPPFPTQKSCQAYIDNNLDDLKLLFGVE